MKVRYPENQAPRTHFGRPTWWHHHGTKLEIVVQTPTHLELRSRAANLTISRNGTDWLVSYEVVHTVNIHWNRGMVPMTHQELAAAFGLNNLTGQYDEDLIARYGAESAEQGLFIRWQNYLNIPGPGTGHDGDPNISIEITPEIKKAVSQFLATVS